MCRYISSIENDHNVVVYKLSDVAKFNSTCGNSKLTAKLHHLQVITFNTQLIHVFYFLAIRWILS